MIESFGLYLGRRSLRLELGTRFWNPQSES